MPGEWMLLAMAAGGGTTVQAWDAWLVTAAALAISVIGRRRLPLGVAEGLFVVGLSAALLLNFIAWGSSAEAVFREAASLVSLAVVWFIVALWVEREAAARDEDLARRRAVRQALAIHAAAASGVVATGVLVATHQSVGTIARGLMLLLLPLLVVAGGLYLRLRGALSRYAVIGLLLLLLRWAWPQDGIDARQLVLSRVLLLVGLATLVTALGAILLDWRRRVARWDIEPQGLLAPPPEYRHLFGAIVVVCVLVGMGGVLLPSAGWTPLAVALAAYAAFIIGHRWRSNAVGELGLVLAAEGIITASLAWLPRSPSWVLLGWAVAGAYAAWLAGFWEQQLDRGLPWTTAGRLIPAARNVSLAAIGGQLAVVAVWVADPGALGAAPGRWSTLLAVLFLLGQWWLLAREARVRESATAALAACLILVVALVPLGQFTASFGLVLRPGILLAAAAVALALRVGPGPASGHLSWPWNAYVGGILPGAVAYDLALGTWTGWVGPGVAVAGVLLALAIHGRRGLLTGRGVL